MSYGTHVIGEAPPTYDQATDPNAPPPTYDSLYGELREVHSPKGFVGFIAKVAGLVVGTVTAAIVIAALNFIPIIMIIIGGMNWSNCPVEPWIPRWLVIAGVLATTKSAANMFYRAQRRRRGESVNPIDNVKPNPFDGILGCLILAWFIAGTVWVYSTSPQYADAHSPRYCDNLTFVVAFIVITVTYALAALIILFFCCCGCCIAIVVSNRPPPGAEQDADGIPPA